VSWEIHAGLTGSAYVPFDSNYNTIYQRSAVTDIGTAEPLESVNPKRYLHLGWWAFYEDLDLFPWDGPGGKYLSQYHFLNYERENWADTTSEQAQGYSGFFYRLYPGVEVTLAFFQP
jgi:hypothetical protein